MASAAQLAPIRSEPKVWKHWYPDEPPQTCRFEDQLKLFGLEDEPIEHLASARSYKHIAIRLWCRKNAHRYYVPTYLLAAWGIDDDFAWTE